MNGCIFNKFYIFLRKLNVICNIITKVLFGRVIKTICISLIPDCMNRFMQNRIN